VEDHSFVIFPSLCDFGVKSHIFGVNGDSEIMSHTWTSQIASSPPEPYLLSKSRPPPRGGAILVGTHRDLEVLLAALWPHILVSSSLRVCVVASENTCRFVNEIRGASLGRII